MNKISLIIATYNRVDELVILLNSLSIQTYKNFEVIVVDQNDKNILDVVLSKFSNLNLIHIRSKVKGLSINRNIGLKHSTGQIIAFPDDDCYYDQFTLEKVSFFFNTNQFNIYTCNVISDSKKLYSKKSFNLTRNNVFYSGISFTIFIKPNNLNDIIFDELLGVGSEYGAGEETDMLLNLLKIGYSGYYNGNEYIMHPLVESTSIKKAFNYAKGFGAIYKKEIFIRNNYWLLIKFLIDLIKRVSFLLIPFTDQFGYNKQKKIIFQTVKGRLIGILFYPLK